MADLTTDFLTTFTLLRPWWLLGIPVAIGVLMLTQRLSDQAGWGRSIDPELISHLRVSPENSSASLRNKKLRWWLLLPLSVGFVALSGPSWQHLPGSAAANQQAMIIVLDLSPSMLARDVLPNRLTIAKLKLKELLARRSDGDTALIVYSGSVHRIAPLTDDAKIISSLVNTLTPALMPVSGSEIEDAIAEAGQLLVNAGLTQGDILVISDGMNTNVSAVQERLNTDLRIRLSILGVGTETGAPIPDEDGVHLLDEQGKTIVANLNVNEMKNLADHFNGHFSQVSVDFSDIDYLLSLPALPFRAKVNDNLQTFDSRHDAGYWLILLLLPLAAYLFRQHLIWVCIPIAILPLEGETREFSQWWQTTHQQGITALDNNDLEKAAELLTDSHWQAIIRYRQERYDDAILLFRDDTSATGYYNLGNALAMSGQYEAALEAYTQALVMQSNAPELPEEDIQFNHLLVKRILEDLTEKEKQQNPPDRRGGDGDRDQNETSDISQEENESRESASEGEQQKIGGDTGEGESLNQQSMQQQGTSAATDQREKIARDPATDATTVDSNTSDTTRTIDEGKPATTTTTTFEKNDNTVLNPYSEQWLRELPQDPGGYLRRKFSYEYQTRTHSPHDERRY